MMKTKLLAIILFCTGLCSSAFGDLVGITSNGELIRIDPNSGAGTLIGNTGLTGFDAMDVSDDGRVFAVTNSDALYEIDINTAAATLIGNITNTEVVEGLAFASDGSLFGTFDQNGGFRAEALGTIDTSTAAGTFIGGFINNDDMEAIAFLPDGTLIGANLDPGKLFEIDTITGESTEIGSTGLLYGLDYGNGALYGTAHTNILGSPSTLVTVDPTTGVTTNIGAIGFDSVTGIGFVNAIPEPSSALLLTAAIGVFAIRRKRI